jgi:hypothetical protein
MMAFSFGGTLMDAKFLEGVVGIVEANSFERMCLWDKHKDKSTWVQNLSGYGKNVGYITPNRPVFISLTTAIINGHKILFVEPTSVGVDYTMIWEWMKENVPSAVKPSGYLNKTDSMNFHNVFPQ